MDTMHKLRAAIMKILGVVITLLFILMTLVGTYQIVTRYFFNRPSTISEELLTYSFTWMSLLASAYVFGKRDHMRMGFMADKLTGPARRYLEVFIDALSFLLCRGCHGIRRHLHHKADHDPDHSIPQGAYGIYLCDCTCDRHYYHDVQSDERGRHAAHGFWQKGGCGSMNIAVVCGLIILVLLVVMLLAGFPLR